MNDSKRSPLLAHEDWWAIWMGGLLIAAVVSGLVSSIPAVGGWSSSPFTALGPDRFTGLIVLGVGLTALTTLAVRVMGAPAWRYAKGFFGLFILAVVAYGLAQQTMIRAAGVGYAFWALAIGLVVANTAGTPGWLKPALRGELYIKTGLVLLGAEILFGNILVLGVPGLFVAWLVTPVVLLTMYWFGTRWLAIPSRGLVVVIAAATSVCGVSAAIATAAAARVKKEELTLAVGMSLIFTVVMMVLMPLGIRASGMDTIVGAAWIGGTVDATGAVVAAGALLGDQAEQVAAVVKLIQNMMIGLVAFLVAVYWVTRIESNGNAERPSALEIWHRFPKFILGFVGASLMFSFLFVPVLGEARVASVLDVTSDLRGWLFCLAFLSIGLESSFRELGQHITGGRPIQLYVVGQTFNIVLTLIAAYLAFGGILFDRIPIDVAGARSTEEIHQVIPNNLAFDVEASALFYTEVNGWADWIGRARGLSVPID
jgi:uncharacterized membrane protein YadS